MSASGPVRPCAIRITAVETTVVNAEMRNWVLVKVAHRPGRPVRLGRGEPRTGRRAPSPARSRTSRRCSSGATRATSSRSCGSSQAQLLPARHHRRDRDQRHRARALGHLRQVRRPAGLAAARRPGARQGARLHPPRARRHARRSTSTFDAGPLREQALAVVEQGYDALKVVFIPYGHHLTGHRRSAATSTR